NAQRQSLDEENQSLRTLVRTWRFTAESTGHAYADLNSSHEQLKARLASTEAQRDQLMWHIGQIERGSQAGLAASTAAVKHWQTEHNKATKAATSAKGIANLVQHANARMSSEVQQLQSQIASSFAKSEADALAADRLHREMAAAKLSARHLEEMGEQKDAWISDLQEKVSSAAADHQQALTRAEQLSSDLDGVRQKLETETGAGSAKLKETEAKLMKLYEQSKQELG